MSEQHVIDYYFHILGLPSSASYAEVERARKYFAQVLHPDVVSNPKLKDWANERMAEINNAHDRLKDWFNAGCPRDTATSSTKEAGPDFKDAPDWTVWEEHVRQDWTKSAKDWEDQQRQKQAYINLERERDHRARTINLARNVVKSFVVILWIGCAGSGIMNGCVGGMYHYQPAPEGLHLYFTVAITAVVWWLMNSQKSTNFQMKWIQTGSADEEVAAMQDASAKAAKLAYEKATQLKDAAEKLAREKAAELKAILEEASAQKAASAKERQTESNSDARETEHSTGADTKVEDANSMQESNNASQAKADDATERSDLSDTRQFLAEILERQQKPQEKNNND